MDVKSSVLPKGLSGKTPAPVSRAGGDEKEQQLSTDVSASSSPSLSSVRDSIVKELLQNSALEANRFYDGTLSGWTVADITTVTGSAVSFGDISQGTGYTQRLGDSIRERGLRFCMHIRPNQTPGGINGTSGVSGIGDYSNAFRVIIFTDRMPVIGGACYVDSNSWALGATAPVSSNALFTNPRAAFSAGTTVYPGMALLAVRNPQTLSRYHVHHDRIYNICSRPGAAVTAASGNSFLYETASEYIDVHVPLHGRVTQWYDQANAAAQFTNKLYFLVVADCPVASQLQYKWMTEIEFENEP